MIKKNTIKEPGSMMGEFAFSCPVCVCFRLLNWTAASNVFGKQMELFCSAEHRLLVPVVSEKAAQKLKCCICSTLNDLIFNKYCDHGELVISSDCLYTSDRSILRAKCMRPYTTNGHVIGAEFITSVHDLNEKLRNRISICSGEHQTVLWEITRAHRVFEQLFDAPFHDNVDMEPYNALFTGYNRKLGLGFICEADRETAARVPDALEFGKRAHVLVIVLPDAATHETSSTDIFVQFVVGELERFCRVKSNQIEQIINDTRRQLKKGRAEKRLFKSIMRVERVVERVSRPAPVAPPIARPIVRPDVAPTAQSLQNDTKHPAIVYTSV